MNLNPSQIKLTFAGLSVGAQVVAASTATGSGLVAATEEANVGASTWFTVGIHFTGVTPN